jgi:hypothetical protein
MKTLRAMLIIRMKSQNALEECLSLHFNTWNGIAGCECSDRVRELRG